MDIRISGALLERGDEPWRLVDEPESAVLMSPLGGMEMRIDARLTCDLRWIEGGFLASWLVARIGGGHSPETVPASAEHGGVVAYCAHMDVETTLSQVRWGGGGCESRLLLYDRMPHADGLRPGLGALRLVDLDGHIVGCSLRYRLHAALSEEMDEARDRVIAALCGLPRFEDLAASVAGIRGGSNAISCDFQASTDRRHEA